MSHSYWLLFYLFGLSSCLSHLQFFTEVIAVWMTSECLEREGQKFSKTAEGWMKGEFICINSKTFSIFPLLCTWFSWCDCASLLLTFKPRAISLCYLSVTQSMHTLVSGHRIPLGFHFTVFKSVFLPLWTEGKVFPLQICLLCTSLWWVSLFCKRKYVSYHPDSSWYDHFTLLISVRDILAPSVQTTWFENQA